MVEFAQIANKLLTPVKRRMQLMVDRAIVTTVNNSLTRQNLQLIALEGETPNNVERFVNYGSISYPPDGSEAIVVCPGANRDAMVAVAVDHKTTRPQGGEQGDSGLYHLEGHLFILTKDGLFNLSGKKLNLTLETEVVITTPKHTINADETIFNGKVVVNGGMESQSLKSGDINATKTLKVASVDVGKHSHLDAEDRPTKAPTAP
ncbi:phage baseplate assembly protein V [Vibrio scophthalmi]|uniref:Prophage MuSo2, baseplate assembly protein V n=1 Tax=Vibrio scophthalmi LMG 19158 TaxID=870967 RepID=F9RTI5_9VIBR|nr:phage baseplate assembly protein V [Vibrio scophthalmi]EGU31083.1 prophage MuSo2, baseplate assembly protein V [Vibrio scophthalmi LMG 19158]